MILNVLKKLLLF